MPGLVPGIHVFIRKRRKAWIGRDNPVLDEYLTRTE
jgi:hypothetical protein